MPLKNDKENRKSGSTGSLAESCAALREEVERYALALQGSDDGIWDWDLATGKVFFSDRWKSILGYSPEEISDDVEEWKSRIHPEDIDHVMAVHREHFEGNSPHFEAAYRLRHKDGAYRWILGRGVCLRDDKGVPTRAAGSHVDITRRKEAEERLRLNEERIRALLSALPDLIFRIDADGTFLDFHTPSPDMLALPSDQFIGKSISDVMPTEIARESLRFIAEALRTGKACPIQEYRLVVGGRLTDFEARFVRCGPDEVIAIIRDVSAMRQAEETTRRNEGLRRKIEKYEAIGRMAGGLSHHLNNLMTIVTGYSELLLSRVPEDDSRHKEIVKIRTAGERAAELIRQLVSFSRLQVLHPRRVDVNAFLANLSTTLDNLAGRTVRFTFSPGDGMDPIRVDPDSLREALFHLVSKAREAMPGGGELRVTTSAVEGVEPIAGGEPPQGRFALITIQDNGCGLDAITRDRIFEPFHTLDSGHEGLELPAVYGFVKQSGGYIFVGSSPGRGTTFRIYLPCLDRTADPRPGNESPLDGTPDAG